MSIETKVHDVAATHAILHSPDGLLWCDRIEIDLAGQTATLFSGEAAVLTVRYTETVRPRQNISILIDTGFRVKLV